MTKLKILVIDDEQRIADSLRDFFIKKGFEAYGVYSPEKAFELLKTVSIDVVISDVMLPQMNGIEVLRRVKEISPEIEVILISGHGNMKMVIEAMRLGAIDFIPKPFKLLDVQIAIERTGKYLQLQNQLKLLDNQRSLISRELEQRIERDFIGHSDGIRSVLKLALTAAEYRDVNVLITGENGTGKEIIARIIHHASERTKYPFFPVNSSAIPESLLESEFFGHIKGAYTGATENKKGCFELASGGTLFLDEIADMPFALQAKLLRAIEEKKIRQVGSNREIKVDLRFISATNKDIQKMVAENKFRVDLFFRINTFIINIPPLRERPDDIEPLLHHFVEQFAGKQNRPVPTIDTNVFSRLKQYSFPGNVRELKNMVQRAMILNNSGHLKISDFELDLPGNMLRNHDMNLDENEKQLIEQALKLADCNQTQAAELLGISRDSLKRRIRKHDIRIERHVE